MKRKRTASDCDQDSSSMKKPIERHRRQNLSYTQAQFDEMRLNRASDYDNEGEGESGNLSDDQEVGYDVDILDEETAQKIYNKLLNDKNKRNPTVKKNWGSDEIKMLEFAVNTYLRK